MKKIYLILFFLTICTFSIGFTACSKIDFKYTIDFIVDGETVASVGTDCKTIKMPKNPMKEGYSFDGWYWDDGLWYNEFTLVSIAEKPLQEENRFKVYAKFKSMEYYFIKFDCGMGTGEMADQKIKSGVSTVLNKMTFTAPNGYVFDGWSYNGVRYNDEQNIKDLCEVGETIKLYAEWRTAYYTVKYDANGGTGTIADTVESIIYGLYPRGPYSLTPPSNMEFSSWNTKSDGTGIDVPILETTYFDAKDGDVITLYAQWQYAKYTVNFHANGGSGEMESILIESKYGAHAPNEFTAPSGALYFNGWNTKADGTGISIGVGELINISATTGIIDLYAQWVTLNGEGTIYIDSVEDFSLMRGNSSGKVFSLVSDIDCKGIELSPIGTNENPFIGYFFGNGHIISNFTIEEQDNSSFFGVVRGGGEIHQLGLENFTCTGIIAASFATTNDGIIKNCYSNGTIIGKDYGKSVFVLISGIASNSFGVVEDCYFSGNMLGSVQNGELHVYGIASEVGNIIDCFSCCTINVSGNVSIDEIKIVGYMNGASDCYFFDEISVTINGEKVVHPGVLIDDYVIPIDRYNVNTENFYSVMWSSEVWDFSNLDVENAKLPKLKIK